ncbi:MAG TPA: amidase family protein, partial [Thermoanaerobaculia bacterium]
MSSSRREFLARTAAGIVGVAAGTRAAEAPDGGPGPALPPGQPPAFGTAPAVGPEVGPGTFAEAEKLVQVSNTEAHRALAARNWRESMAALYERRAGPRKVALEETLAPATQWTPGPLQMPRRNRFVRSSGAPAPKPDDEGDLAYATVAQLSRWIETRTLSSTELTRIYLDRLERFDPKLRCVITLTKEHALAQAKRADEEIGQGRYRGPLHGIPWGAKDLLDTKGIPTTYGAEPYRERVPSEDAAVTKRLDAAGAVLVAK